MSEPETYESDEQEDEEGGAYGCAFLLIFFGLLVIAAFYLEAAWASGDPVKLRVAIAYVVIGALSLLNYVLTGSVGIGFLTGWVCYCAAYFILAWLARTS